MTAEQALKSLDFRPAVADDAPRIVEIYNHQERDTIPLTVARCQKESDEAQGEPRGERDVALREGYVVGVGSYRWAWWTGQPGIYAMEIHVDPLHCRQGIGTGLFNVMYTRLLLRGATRIVGWLRSESSASRGFAARLGCYETGQVIQEYHLPIPEADISAYAGLEARLIGEGLRIGSLVELGKVDELFLRALQHLWADSGDAAPDTDRLRDSFASWQQQVLQAPGLSPITHWIALDGDRPVGMTFLKRLSDNAFENDYTGVAATHRGRGIATALKLRAIIWAQQRGVEWFTTSSEIGNRAMITINVRLGYRPGAERREVALDAD